jgi:hypothetical protein
LEFQQLETWEHQTFFEMKSWGAQNVLKPSMMLKKQEHRQMELSHLPDLSLIEASPKLRHLD